MKQMPDLLLHGDFASLGTGDTAMLAGGMRPLAWIDGLMTATMISPQFVDAELWLEHVCDEEALGNLTLPQMERCVSVLAARQLHIVRELEGSPATYRPFLGDQTDKLAAAGAWAAGFRFGICLQPEPWAPLIDDDDTRTYLGVIFCLERDEDLSEEERADGPFADIAPARRHEMRLSAIEMLPAAVVGLLAASDVSAEEDNNVDLFADAGLPYWRPAPKVGRNAPCPCGSGRKYKKCCLNADEHSS